VAKIDGRPQSSAPAGGRFANVNPKVSSVYTDINLQTISLNKNALRECKALFLIN
jgi:hypothetical protein